MKTYTRNPLTNLTVCLLIVAALSIATSAKFTRIFSRLLLVGFVVLAVALAFLPWRQFVAGSGRVIAVHQPHLYSRTQRLAYEFAKTYERLADRTVTGSSGRRS